jgi:DNA topoisomerase-1
VVAKQNTVKQGTKRTRRAAATPGTGEPTAVPPDEAGGESAPARGGSLVIVESPTKAKTIGKYLGRGYTVKATVGHIRDLPPRKLGVDVDHGFATEYVTIK